MKTTTITKCVNQAVKSLSSIDSKSAATAGILIPVVIYVVDQVRDIAHEAMEKHYKFNFKCQFAEVNLEPADAS